jgi:hypothetical protein
MNLAKAYYRTGKEMQFMLCGTFHAVKCNSLHAVLREVLHSVPSGAEVKYREAIRHSPTCSHDTVLTKLITSKEFTSLRPHVPVTLPAADVQI